jgi:septum formation protein
MNFNQHKKIVLASGSPRRRAYLEKYQLKFQIITGEVDETVIDGESPEDYSQRMAQEKAQAVFESCDQNTVIIAADTIVVLEGKILGKPVTRQEVLPMLQCLNGNLHQVITSYQLIDCQENKRINRSVSTGVRFNILPEWLLKAYAESDEPLDKAGAYSIQGLGTILVHSISGSYNNVVGLPIEILMQDLLNLGVISIKGNS